MTDTDEPRMMHADKPPVSQLILEILECFARADDPPLHEHDLTVVAHCPDRDNILTADNLDAVVTVYEKSVLCPIPADGGGMRKNLSYLRHNISWYCHLQCAAFPAAVHGGIL